MATCDICKKQCNAYDLTALRDMYAQPGLKDMCPECCRWAEGQLREIRGEQEVELKRRICERANRPEKRRWVNSWWVALPVFCLFVYAFIHVFSLL